MNRVYRLVWNRALAVVQVTSELARTQGSSSGASATRVLRRHPLALAVAALALACVTAPAWSQTCTSFGPSGCGASGGIGGRPGRSPTGGAGNGTGGDAIVWNPNTSESAGSTASNGTGGNGASGVFNVGSVNITAAGGAGGAAGAIGSTGVVSSVTGSTGAAGQAESGSSIVGGGGGGGGAGVYINDANSSPIVGSITTIAGGAGGKGGDATASVSNGNATNGDPGGGGGGGAGVIIAAGAGGVSLINNGRLLGGAGGAGGNGGYAGSGGGGGDGLLVLGAGSAVTNNTTGSIIGGLGGNPGIYQDGGNLPGGYGGGGAGVNLVGAGSSLENAGTIIGGNASTISPIPSAQDGTPGVGVRGWGGVTVVTDGSIAGGNNSTTQADSVLFSGGGNQLVVLSGASFTGNIQSISGNTNGGDTFTLAGVVNGSLNAGLITGFASNTKTGNSNWTLTGTGNTGINWTIQQGVLTGSASAFNGSLTFMSNGTGTPAVDFNQTATGSFAGSMLGAGQFIKDGTGSLTMSGDMSTFSGPFTINQGTVSLTGNGNLQGAEVADGGAFDVSGTSGTTATIAGLSGTGTVTLGAHTLAISSAASDNFMGTIGGTGGVTINGGVQTFSGPNAYTGTTTLNGGTLIVSADTNLGQSTGALTLNGGTLQTVGAFTTTRDISLGNMGGTLQTVADLTVAGGISGNGALMKTGAGTLTLSGTNSYIGGTTVSAGILQGDAISLQGNITDNAALVFNQTGNGTYVGAISGSGTLTKTGTGTLMLTAGNSYSGGTTISAGTLQGNTSSLQGNIVNNAALVFNQAGNGFYGGVMSGTGTLTANGSGTLILNGINTANGLATVTSGSTLLVGDSSHATATVGGDVSVNGGTLGGYGTVQGSVVLANGAGLTPGSALGAGTLTVNGDLTIGSGSQLNFDFGAPGPNFSTPGQSDHVVVNGSLSIDSSTLNVNNLGSMGPGLYNLFNWGGTLSITGGGFAPPSGMSLQILTVTKQINLIDTLGLTLNEWDANGLAGPGQMGGGSGTWSLYSNTWSDTTGQFVGPMTPQPGFAIFGGASGTVTVDDTNGTVGATGMQFVSDGYHLTGGAINLVGQGGVAPVLRVSSGDTATIDNVLHGVNGLNKTDGGTLVLNGINVYTGTTTLSGGNLSVSSDANLGASTNALDFEGGTLEVTGTTFNQTARSIIWGNTGGGFDIDNAANVFTVAQALTGNGGLAKSGAGTLMLTGADTYAGNTTISGGTLALSGSGSIAQSTDVNVGAGATFDISGTPSGASITSLDGSGVVNLGSRTLTLTQASGNFAGMIAGTGGLTLASGNETLAGVNLYTGGTAIHGGTLALSGSGALAQSSDVNVASGGVFDISSTSHGAYIVSLDGNGTVNLGNQMLTLTNAAGTFGGTIAGNGGLTLAGGAETLAGSNTYLGGTTITGATLSVLRDANLGDTSGGLTFHGGTLVNTASFNTARNMTLAGNGTFDTVGNLITSGNISGPGALIKNGTSYLVLTGVDTYTGGTTINAGTLQVGNNGTVGSITGNVMVGASGVLTFYRSDALDFTGAISGSGALVQNAGSLTLDGNSSAFSGITAVNGGRLIVGSVAGNGAALGGNVFVYQGSTLGGNGSVGNALVMNGGIVNPGSAVAGSLGTLTVSGNLSAMQGAQFNFDFGAPGASFQSTGAGDSVKVGGNLDLEGVVLNVNNAGGMGPGLYNVFSYGGTLTQSNGGVALGTVPAGQTLFLQNLTAQKQINLIDTTGLALDVWNANGMASATQMGGGSGTWSTTAPLWTDATGTVPNTVMQPQPGFAIFGGAPGTITVDDSAGSVSATGLQFAVNGYTLGGGTLTLVASNGAAPIVRVGDGASDGAGMTATINSVIAGSAGLNKTDLGTLVLTGANSYTGGTTISGGTLVVDSTSLPGAVTDNATLVFDQASTGTFNGAIGGNGSFAKTGAGMLILDGNSSGFAGTTTVQAGTLEVGDAGTPLAALGGNVTVASGGTLRGHGTIGGNVINDGTVWAGGSIGTLTVQGNYTQTANGVFEVEATPTGQASLLSIGGTANLAGTALVLADTGTWMPLTSYTVLIAAGGISGQFASASSSLPFLTPMLAYGTNAVTLSLQRNDINFNTVAQTSNQRAVATAANLLGFTNPAYSALVVLDAPAARHAFDQLSGEIHASTRTAIQDDDRYVRDAIGQHLAGMTNNANGLNVTDGHGLTAWTAVWGHWGSHDSDGNASSFKANGSGVLVGADLPVGDDARLGAVIGSGQGTTRIDTLGSSSHVLNQHIGIYGMAQTGPLQWQGGAIYGLQHVSTNRIIGFGSFAGTAHSDYHADAAQGYVDASWPVALGNTTLAPFANLAYDNLHTPAFGESGTPAALNVASQDSGVGYATLGLRATFDLGAPSHGLHAHAGLGWQRAWGDTLPGANERFASGGDSFEVAGLPVARDAAAISGGISFTITPNVSVDASYQGQFAHRASDQAARMSLDWKF